MLNTNYGLEKSAKYFPNSPETHKVSSRQQGEVMQPKY
jgi:hypothetical protein